MLHFKNGDIIKTIDGRLLYVKRSSKNYLYGINLMNNAYFITSRHELENKIMEVQYYGK